MYHIKNEKQNKTFLPYKIFIHCSKKVSKNTECWALNQEAKYHKASIKKVSNWKTYIKTHAQTNYSRRNFYKYNLYTTGKENEYLNKISFKETCLRK